jgi:ribonuclease VapC
LIELLTGAKVVAIGAPVMLEAGIVAAARGLDPRMLTGYLDAIGAEVLDFRKEHQSVALQAFLRFGKGRHPASLNYGDCMSYAFARITELTLAYTGGDFGQTDLTRLAHLDA